MSYAIVWDLSTAFGDGNVGPLAPAYNVVGTSIEEVSRKVESTNYSQQFFVDRSRFIPQIDFSNPANFAKFGSAEQYYKKSIENIYRFYPYDGSLKEKLQWHNESTYLDNYIFEFEYPRTNGYVEIGETWGTVSATKTEVGGTYKLSTAPQLIFCKGGPHAASIPAYATASYAKDLNFKEEEQKANIYDADTRQVQNFTIGGVRGNTVEFWLKLPLEPSKSQASPSHAYFDLWNQIPEGNSQYGRFLVETRCKADADGNPNGEYQDDHMFHVTYMSGTAGVLRAKLGSITLSGALGISLSDWNHYSFSVINTSNEDAAAPLEMKLHINGELVETNLTGTTVSNVHAETFGLAYNAVIGAYQTAPGSDAAAAGVTRGYGSLSGSYIDEFRYWTEERDSDKIKFNWFKQVAGGTNTDYGTKSSKFYEDTNPVNLGVYYKFNEGITQTSSIDQVTLDYSGRVSNGFIENYSTAMRNTGSAMVESNAARTEFKDPIIYNFHPSVLAYENSSSYKGREYDTRNSMYLFNMLPTWVIEEDEFKGKNQALYLNQIIASYFDDLFLQIQSVPSLKNMQYLSGSSSGSMHKPLPFADKLLSNTGLVVPEIFSNANVFEALANRDDNREFESKLADIKNNIYTNLYNNLLYINKSKGTIKSITNMMRCFGVDEDLYSINFYANNAILDLKGNFTPKSIRKSYADFNFKDRFGATVFQMTSSGNPNSVSFITGSSETPAIRDWQSENGFTVEAEVLFPKNPGYSDPSFKDYQFPHFSASLFGMHTALTNASDNPGDTTWRDADWSNFQVYAVREKANDIEPESSNVRFILTSSNPNATISGLIPEMSSKTFKNVYNNERWNLSVKIYPSKYPKIGILSGSSDVRSDYTVEFSGYNVIGDTIQNSFNIVSGRDSNTVQGAGREGISQQFGEFINATSKRLYVGSHRTNFTGSLLTPTNVKISSCRYWAIPLDKDELISHAMDPKNYGVYNTMRSSYLLQDNGSPSTYPVDIPKIKTLILNWDFDTLTGSDSGEYGGEFTVQDFSSGSGDTRYKETFSNLIEKQHTGRGIYFGSGDNNTGSISKEYVFAHRQQVMENLNHVDAVKVLEQDDEFFTKRTKPVDFSFSIEKSMYQNISEEMLNMLAASKDASAYSTLMGKPSNKYRDRYKEIEKLRNIFFERVGQTPDVDKYIEYFKWLDTSISQMIYQIVPASSNFTPVRNVIESHVLERSGKYKHKFPTIERFYKKPLKVKDLPDNLKGQAEKLSSGNAIEGNVKVAQSLNGMNINSISNANFGYLEAQSMVNWGNNHATSDTNDMAGWWKNQPFSADNEKTTGDLTLDNTINDAAFTYTTDYNLNYLDSETGEPITAGNQDTVGQASSVGMSVSVDSGGEAALLNDQNKSRPKKDRNFRNVVFNEAPAGSGTRISFNTNTLARQTNTVTFDKVSPNRKFKPEFGVEIPSISTEREYDGRKYAPVSFQSSSTDNPFVTGSSPWYIGYEISTQHLQDYYLDTKDLPMQGPFTEQNVGGYAYRHGGIHIEPSADGGYKPEAWYAFRTVTGAPDGIKFDFYNPFDLINGAHYPRALYTRGSLAKRPLNIRNIKSTTGSYLPQRTDIPPINELGNTKVSIGNYEKDYQIVQIANRDVNNRYFVDNNGISTSSAESTGTPSISGAYDWAVPDRGKNEYIFVSRFSSPGGPETNGSAFLNYESEVYSPYNAMTYRNLSVRQPLKTLLTRHTAFGGYDSVDGAPSASYHKTQRNAVKRIEYTDIFGTATTSSIYDNYYVQHQIPQSDRQYAWITASAITTPLGFSQRDYANRSYGSTDITFVSASDFGAFISVSPLLAGGRYIFGRPASSAGALFLPQDFVGLNNFGYFDSDEMDNNTLLTKLNTDFVGATIVGGAVGFAAPVEALNAQLLKGNGPYGQSSWKQIQNLYHPIVRYMKSINRFSILTEKTSISPGDAKEQFIKTQTLENFTEPMVSFKYKPLEHDIMIEGDDGDSKLIEVDSTFANYLGTFANNKIDELLSYSKDLSDKKLIYNSMKNIYMKKGVNVEFSPIKSLEKLSYREVVYPRERNTGLARTRTRQNYTVSSGSDNFNLALGESRAFWKNNINDRLRSDAVARNAQGLIIASGSSFFGLTDMSIWPLDSEEPFFDLYRISGSGGEGGKHNPHYWAPLSPSSAAGAPLGGLNPDSTPRIANLNKNGELSYAGYIYGLFGINIQGKVRAEGALTSSGPLPNFLGNGTSDDGLNFNPTASFQFEYPNMMMSGAAGSSLTNTPTASLHLMAPYRTDILSGKTPWFNSYEDYAEDIRRIAKDYTVIPEFRISDHIDYYLKEGFFADNNKFLDIIGSSLVNTSSATSETGSFQPDFFKIYSHTDFMKHFSVIQEDHKKDNTAFASKIRLEAKAVKKLLPYQGFYPVLRSVQLGQLFSSSYAPFITGSNVRDGAQERLAALYQPFFAPGIFFNTIKSGIAVSYPVHTASAPELDKTNGLTVPNPTSASLFVSNIYTTTPNYNFPFEAILDPDQYLPLSSSLTSSTVDNLSSSVYFVYPNFTGSTSNAFYDNFYVAQTVDSPYTPLVGIQRDQPQFFFEWKGQSDPKYSLASSNFFAESVDFFLERGTLTSFVSKAEKDFKSMTSGSTYYMDVLLYKTDDYVSYEGPPSGTFNYDGGKKFVDRQLSAIWHGFAETYGDGLLNLGVSARGMHYGPAYKSSGIPWGSTGTGSVPFAAFRAQDPNYAPHTPPYFYGTSRARIAFKPDKARDMSSGESAKFTLEEILSNARVETIYQNENERAKTLQENSYRNNNAAGIAQMQLSSSVNLFGQITLKEVEYGTERNADGTFKPKRATTPVVQGTNDAWIIETKFECPSINLAHMDTASLGAGIGDGKEKYHTRGIWKGYGTSPTGSEGIFLQLKESYPQITNGINPLTSSTDILTGSLIEVCGFKASKERVGEIRSKKTISEAIVAVPIDEKGNFYAIEPTMFKTQKLNYETNGKALMVGDYGVEKPIGETSITQMIEKMKKFSLPPQMDFINNSNIDPFVMYIFEFTHTLDKQDLVDIWQNLMPKISTKAEKAESFIEHPVGVNYEFFGQYKKGKLPDNIRWMVFKVKQKARNNYFNITQQSEVAKGFTFTALNELQGVASNPEAELTYSYNWPYDFFSLVELAQIESEAIFEPPKE